MDTAAVTGLVAAGSAYVVVSVSSTISEKVYSNLTPEGKVKALQRLLCIVEERHKYFVEKVLPKLQPTYSGDPAFQGSQDMTELLERSDAYFFLL